MMYSSGMSSLTGKQYSVPIYEELAERLRRSIRKGDYSPGQLLGSEYELARQESISRMTVRRASELLVGEGLLERRPGKGLYVRAVHVNSRMVQMISGNMQWEPSVQISRGANNVAKQQGIQVQLYDAHGDPLSDLDTVRSLPQGLSRGAIIMSLHSTAFNEAVYSLKLANFPFVLVDQSLREIDVSSVTADNYAGGHMAAQALLELGHRHIAFIGDLVANTVCDRLTGMRDAIADAGLPFDRSLVIDLQAESDRLGEWSLQVDNAVRQLMSHEARPTAFFCSCDGVARLAYRTLSQMGVSIPDDVSLIGFDDDPLAEWLTPGLTSIHQPFAEMGQAAMEILARQFENPLAPVERRILPVELVRRGSISSPKNMC